MNHGITVAPGGQLADPVVLVELAVAAEESGWDAMFLWDHVLRPEVNALLDPWVALAAMAGATSRIRIGPMVTPIGRRRLIKLAREVITVDLLSSGRLTLGLGLGVDTGGELSRFGEVVDTAVRGRMLDEGADTLASLLEGERVRLDGEFFKVDDVVLEPRPVQRPRPPIWCAARGDAQRPARRAARFEGLFPIEVDRDQLMRMLESVSAVRGDLDGFDVCHHLTPGEDPPGWAVENSTWVVLAWPPTVTCDEVLGTLAAGPAE